MNCSNNKLSSLIQILKAAKETGLDFVGMVLKRIFSHDCEGTGPDFSLGD